jgi:hypothetical protein
VRKTEKGQRGQSFLQPLFDALQIVSRNVQLAQSCPLCAIFGTTRVVADGIQIEIAEIQRKTVVRALGGPAT